MRIRTVLTYKQIITILGLAMLLSNTVVMCIVFIAAHLNNDLITVTINDYGEKGIESIILPITLILGVYILASYMKDVLREYVKVLKEKKNHANSI
jgi:hypothetical protein